VVAGRGAVVAEARQGVKRGVPRRGGRPPPP
jgi:hypothetical protein